jgi:hypothetical protein
MTKLKGTSIPYGGPSHVALRFACMKRTDGFTVDNLMQVFPQKFTKPSRAVESLNTLSKQGFVYERNGTWKVTYLGATFLRTVVKPYVGDFK